jgi:hypothetical protein
MKYDVTIDLDEWCLTLNLQESVLSAQPVFGAL